MSQNDTLSVEVFNLTIKYGGQIKAKIIGHEENSWHKLPFLASIFTGNNRRYIKKLPGLLNREKC
jgi:hypothetical protein